MTTQFHEEKAKRKLDILKSKEEEESAKLLANRHRLPYLDLTVFPIEIDALKIISEDKAREGELAILQAAGQSLKIAIHNPERPATKAAMKSLEERRYTFDLFLVSKRGLAHAWETYRKVPAAHETTAGAIQISHKTIAALRQEITQPEEIKAKLEATFHGYTSTIFELILAGALGTDASDAHLEPATDSVRLRLRMDGVLHDIASLPQKIFALLLSRIKLVAEMKLNIHDRAQDGRFTIHTPESDIEVRASVLPGPEGENVVLRILNPKSLAVEFKDLGMQPWVRDAMERELKKPNGMIVTTGPTGSGKTTTLYTMLKKVHTPEIKIITIEDPIEYHLPGIEQTQVDKEKGYDFANGLRAIVRQDPDVILVGEIRDFETADTALNAALTGHLVFSTLHTNNAAGAIPRLINLGIKSSSIAPAINVVMAQRLIRKLCSSCRTKADLTHERAQEITSALAKLPAGVPTPPETQWTIFHATQGGCASCHHMGYQGRIGVFEIILIDDAIETLVLKGTSEGELKKAAITQQQIAMQQDGLLKVLAGITDFAEVERVVGA